VADVASADKKELIMALDHGHAVADELSSDVLMRREPMYQSDPLARRQAKGMDNQVRRPPTSSGLYDVLDLILDKGIVIDAFVRVSLVGIELLTVDLRVVIASVDTYLRYAEGVERLHMFNPEGSKKLPEMVGGGMKGHALKKGAEKVGKALSGKGDEDQGEDEGEENEEGVGEKLAHGVRNVLKKGVGRIMERLSGEESPENKEEDEEEPGKQEQSREGGRPRQGNGRHDRPRHGSAHRR